jgi:predicted  nucleic acid-binding Zn-ribbon protein
MRTILTLSIIFLFQINSYSQSITPSIPKLIPSEKSDNFSKKELRTYLESYKKELDTYQSELSKFNSEQNSKINELRGRLIVVESNLNESKSELNRLQKELDLLRPELKSLTDSLNSIHNNYPELRNFITSVFQSLSPENIDHDLKTSHYRDGMVGTFIDSTSFLSKVRFKENLPKHVIGHFHQDFDKGSGYILEKILFI